jgi:DNA-binding protein HU-beta
MADHELRVTSFELPVSGYILLCYNGPMNKRDIVDGVVTHTGMSRAQATAAVDAVFAALADGLSAGEKVNVSGFGSFAPEERKARRALHPRTRQPIRIPARRTVKFRPGASLAARLERA